ncbi:GNAT family N-acetyltransferase [Cohnella zeiphila]|uniref:GNAT family N-acetyltransferase n=1 Tax=Cohnella zeiphila TaxID=2761120 RepID=A0A7X0SP85_9BACL|nr:GNAT family N-acetyltransferase [Cohnella zeiphila]MBB6732360.1 GNAT family N-acetyltransferase [Cohnella zeiphila]
MSIELRPVTRENWRDAISLKVQEDQQSYVPAVAVSLAKIYIKPDGDEVVYLPFAIYSEGTMVGFMMHAYVESTRDMYWINGFLIDATEQKKGYGGAALDLMMSWIINKFPQCKEIRLTVHQDNKSAKAFYQKRGFAETGTWFGEEEVLVHRIQEKIR